jgi:hypothetical protein
MNERRVQATPGRREPPLAAPRRQSPTPPRRTIWQRMQDHPLFVIGSLLASMVGIASYAEGVFRSVDIRPVPQASTSSEDLPFTAANPTPFTATHVKITCVVSNVTWRAAGQKLIRFVGSAEGAARKASDTIPHGESITFPCDVNQSFTSRFANGVPMTLVLARMKVRASYETDIFGIAVAHEVTSPAFTWRLVSGAYEWLENDPSDTVNY